LAVPISKVFEEGAVKVFLRLPMICPAVRATVAELPIMRVLGEVVRLPAERVRVPSYLKRTKPASLAEGGMSVGSR
jgi:hypothetical protein